MKLFTNERPSVLPPAAQSRIAAVPVGPSLPTAHVAHVAWPVVRTIPAGGTQQTQVQTVRQPAAQVPMAAQALATAPAPVTARVQMGAQARVTAETPTITTVRRATKALLATGEYSTTGGFAAKGIDRDESLKNGANGASGVPPRGRPV